jgi:hypothetical protein
MLHKHHIIPRHMGGLDHPNNLILLTVEQHAAAHKTLYEKYGKREDFLAWKSLSKQIGNEEIWLLRSSLGGHGNKNKPKSDEHKKKISEAVSESLSGKEKDYLTKKRISKSMLGNSNSKNHDSEEYRKKQSLAMKEAWKRRKEK